MEENFVPSYKNDEERKKQRKKRNFKNKVTAILVVIIMIVAGLIVAYLGYSIANIEYSKYEKYEEKMDVYGFSKVYNNNTSKTREKVTKSEAVKMILSCVYNVPEIDGIALETQETYSNALWVEYAVKQGIVTREEVNESNADEKVKYKEVLVWLYNVKAKILNMEPETQNNFEVKDINAYNTDTKLAVYDLLNSKVIVTNVKKVDGNKKLFKGKLNELVVNFAEQYNTITVGSSKININEEKIPSNQNMYPYSLASVPKDVYEIDFVVKDQANFITPIEYYRDNKQYYNQMKNYLENYYNYILSIDYNTITVPQLKRRLKKYVLTEFDEEKLERYVEYVKANHIKLSGKATVQLPCVYFDGEDYRVRVKLEIKVDSSDTKENLLLYDLEGSKISYNSDDITIYIDSVLNKNDLSETLFIKEGTISSMIVKSSSSMVKGE